MMHYLFNKPLPVVLGPQGLDIGDGSRCWYMGPWDYFCCISRSLFLKIWITNSNDNPGSSYDSRTLPLGHILWNQEASVCVLAQMLILAVHSDSSEQKK